MMKAYPTGGGPHSGPYKTVANSMAGLYAASFTPV